MEFIVGILFYALIKLFAYTLWCKRGIVRYKPEHANKNANAWGFGLLRLLMGIGIGIVIYPLTISISGSIGLFAYPVVYIPTRIVEWALMSLLMFRANFLLQTRNWIYGGVVVSFIADFPLVLMGGLLGGRPFC
jgi:hypothetical protein